MKKILYSTLMAVIMITACKPKTEPVVFDPAAAKADLTKTLDKIYNAYNTRDAATFLSWLTDDGLYCGTDAKELWDKAAYSKNITEMLADTSFHPALTVDTREIRFSNNGTSAIVVDQFKVEWATIIPVRNILHCIKTDSVWQCNFSSITLIPRNEDLTKIINVVKEKKDMPGKK
jgi:hypothetical protein